MSDEPAKQVTDTAAPAAAAATEGEAPAVESEEAAAPEEESTATFAPVVRFILSPRSFEMPSVIGRLHQH
jgi:hypothetical protein